LEQGVPLDRAVRMPDVRLPAYVEGLLACGLQSGNLAEVLGQFLRHERMREDLRRQTWLAFAYPAFLLAFLTGWTVCMLAIAQEFQRTFNDLDAAASPLTLVSQHVPWLLGVAAIGLSGFLFVTVLSGRLRIASDLLAAVPIAGLVWRDRNLAEWSDLMALLAKQSIPVGEALGLSATAIRDRSLANGCKAAAVRAESGMPLSRCVTRENVFPCSLMPFLEWGEKSGALADALAAASEWFRRRCELHCNLLTLVVPPLVLLLVMAVTMYVLTAFVSPLFEAIEGML
jgi:type II secretory pathway component PulF